MKKRTGTPWMASDAYGKTLTGLSLNLITPTTRTTSSRGRRGSRSLGSAAKDWPHGWRDVVVEDPDGYTFAVGTALP